MNNLASFHYSIRSCYSRHLCVHKSLVLRSKHCHIKVLVPTILASDSGLTLIQGKSLVGHVQNNLAYKERKSLRVIKTVYSKAESCTSVPFRLRQTEREVNLGFLRFRMRCGTTITTTTTSLTMSNFVGCGLVKRITSNLKRQVSKLVHNIKVYTTLILYYEKE